ncbi:type I-A CRISPR-associated protein Cas4/Csa1 [Aeropyrum camini]|uniref:type I-A CRISPR-associated protein Cas4/Csa1 n=1 Tax=Aeropyrum camini TaxID=229980 RepID=UPI0011E58BF0|nr:type I-A CRISPR-associated protein Cas4/Csa1 [Aeropyrum camini]
MFPRGLWDLIRSSAGDGVYAELRGWKWDVVGPRYAARPTLSDVTGVCPVGRDTYLRRVLNTRVNGGLLRLGALVHEAFLLPFKAHRVGDAYRMFNYLLKRVGARGNEIRVMNAVFEKAVEFSAAARVDGIPVAVEPNVPGGPVGLSDYVRPDLLVGIMPVDLVLAGHGDRWIARKELAIAGYALAVEAWTGNPVDYGVVAGLRVNDELKIVWRLVRVDDHLRTRFLERRDAVARIIEYRSYPGLPEACPAGCAFREVCGV